MPSSLKHIRIIHVKINLNNKLKFYEKKNHKRTFKKISKNNIHTDMEVLNLVGIFEEIKKKKKKRIFKVE